MSTPASRGPLARRGGLSLGDRDSVMGSACRVETGAAFGTTRKEKLRSGRNNDHGARVEPARVARRRDPMTCLAIVDCPAALQSPWISTSGEAPLGAYVKVSLRKTSPISVRVLSEFDTHVIVGIRMRLWNEACHARTLF